MPGFTYPASIPTITISSILTRARSIHRVNNSKISLVADPTLANIDPAMFNNDEGACVLAAAVEYNHDAPLRLVNQIQGGDNVYVYDLSTYIPGWDNRFAVEKIMYPLNLPEEVEMYDNAWSQSIDPITNDPVLRFQSNRPSGSAYTAQYPNGIFAVYFLAPHMFDLTTGLTTIPSYHSEAVSQYIAGLMLEQAADIAAQFSDKQIFENKDMGQLADRLQNRANNCKERYREIVEKDQVEFGPFWAKWELDSPTGWRPFHPSNLY